MWRENYIHIMISIDYRVSSVILPLFANFGRTVAQAVARWTIMPTTRIRVKVKSSFLATRYSFSTQCGHIGTFKACPYLTMSMWCRMWYNLCPWYGWQGFCLSHHHYHIRLYTVINELQRDVNNIRTICSIECLLIKLRT